MDRRVCVLRIVENALQGPFRGLIVPEASARADVDEYYTDPDADHFTVSRTKSKISSSFIKLLDFIGDILKEVPTFSLTLSVTTHQLVARVHYFV